MTYTEYDTYHEVRGYYKQYPKFLKYYKYNQPIWVKTAGFEPQTIKKQSSKPVPQPFAFIESIRRTRTKIQDIVICNEFDLFVTFTFKKDRQNVDLIKSRMAQWLKNEKARRGAFSYIIVPEFHKDGKSIHFHALFKNYKGKLIDSGHIKNTRKLYNLKHYKLGFSTAVKIDNPEKVSSYIRKYITKEMPHFAGKKRYWCSSNLQRPKVTENPEVDPFTFAQFTEIYAKNNLTVYYAPIKVLLRTTKSERSELWRKLNLSTLTSTYQAST